MLVYKINEHSINQHYTDRYIKFIQHVSKFPTKETYTEKHHILPRSLFPEYENDENNIVVVSAREHYIAHWLLAKACGGKMWFAFNMMNRIIPSRSSLLYQYARKEISLIISNSNTGRVRSEEFKKGISERFSGMVVVKDSVGNTMMVNKSDPRYVNGDLVYYRVGYKHSESTKVKMSENNHMTGKKPYYCPETESFGYYLEGNEPEGWVYGQPPSVRKKNSESVSKLVWYTNPATGQNIRALDKPKGFVEGRTFKNKGFEKANSMFNVVDLKNRLCCKVEKIEPWHSSQSGKSTQKTLVYRFNGYVFTSAKAFCEYLNAVGIFIDVNVLSNIDKVRSYKVPKPHPRCNQNVSEFRKNNLDKTIADFGIECYHLSDFELLKKDRIWKQI